MTLPKDLDQCANEWRTYIKDNIVSTMIADPAGHVPGTVSVYLMTVILTGENKPPKQLYYVGASTTPTKRGVEHLSEFKAARVTVRVGKSKMYSTELLGGVNRVEMQLGVHASGFSRDEAKDVEKALSANLMRLYGDAVITRARGRGIKS